MNILAIPFNRHRGVTFVKHRSSDIVCLEAKPQHLNHVGTIHAAALYSVAETACGHALLTQRGIASETARAVLRSSSVKYRRPASRMLIAEASIDDETILKLKHRLKTKGRALVDIRVLVSTDDGTQVLTGTSRGL